MKLLSILLLLSFTSYSYAGVHQAKRTYEFDLETVKYISINLAVPKFNLKYKKGIEKAKFSIKALGETKSKAQSVVSPSSEYKGDTYIISNRLGNYSCGMTSKNGKVTKVKGACLVGSTLTLPKGAKVEVYRGDKLVSKQFIPMSIERLLESLDDSFVDKLALIDKFKASHKKTKTKLEITTEDLGKILDELTWDDKKLKALTKLHKSVTDKDNFATMIDENFSHFDKDKARKIVGLPPQN